MQRSAQSIFDRMAGDSNLSDISGQTSTPSTQHAQIVARLKQQKAQEQAQMQGEVSGLATEGLRMGGEKLAESIFADSAGGGAAALADAGATGMGEVASLAAAEQAAELGTDAMGSMSTGGAGLVDTGVTMGATALGVDETTAGIGGDAAGLAMATAAGGPVGAGVYAGTQLLTKGKLLGVDVGSIF